MSAPAYADAYDEHGDPIGASLLDSLASAPWLMAQDFPPVSWAVPGVVPEGYVVLTGAPKLGKSWLVLEWLVAIATGTPALGTIPTGRPRPVLYCALEDNDRRMQRRLRHLGHDLSGADLFTYVTGGRVAPADVLPLVAEYLRGFANARPVVVVDTLGKVTRPAGPGQGAYERDYALGGRFKALAELAPGCTVLAVHHTRKAGSEDWMDSTSGTNGVNGAADATLNLARGRGEQRARLSVTGRDIDHDGTLALVSDEMRWRLDGRDVAEAMLNADAESAAEGLADRSAAVLAFVATNAPASPAQIAQGVGMTAQEAAVYAGRLVKSGRLTRPSRGLYALDDPVVSVKSVVTGDPETTLATLTTPLQGGEE